MKSTNKYHSLLTSPEPGISTRAAAVYETIGWDAYDAIDINHRRLCFIDDLGIIIGIQCISAGDKLTELCRNWGLDFISCMWRDLPYGNYAKYSNIDISITRDASAPYIIEAVQELSRQLLERHPNMDDITVFLRAMVCDSRVGMDDLIGLANRLGEMRDKDDRLRRIMRISSITSFEIDLSRRYSSLLTGPADLMILADDRCIDGVKYDGLAESVTDSRLFTDHVDEFFLKNPEFANIYFYTSNILKSPFIFSNRYAEENTAVQED